MKRLKLYGPPGTGKTYTMLGYFEKELLSTTPDRIGFVTFTRAARAEALSRTSLAEDELPWVKTLHAICYKILGIAQETLVTRDDLRKFGDRIGVQLSGYTPDLFSTEALTDTYYQPTKADRLLQLNHLGRHRGLKLKETLKEAPLELDFQYAKWFTQCYREWKLALGKLDYTDLLTAYLEQGNPLDVDVLFVDEAQDLSWLQWQVVHKLAANCERLYVAGDDDQAIFTWAGASASLFNLEPADEVRILPKSYRLSRAPHGVGQRIISRVKIRQAKQFDPRDADGTYKPIGQLGHEHLKDGSTLVLYRNFHRGTALAQQLEGMGVPFLGANSILSVTDVINAVSGARKAGTNKTLTIPEAKAVGAYAVPGVLMDGARERLEYMTVGDVSGISMFRPEAFLLDWWRLIPKVPRLGYLQRVVSKYPWEKVLKPTVNLMSIHQSKGREADTVCLDMELARRTYESYMKNPDDEHRVYYVAVTRARERLYTILPSDPMAYVI